MLVYFSLLVKTPKAVCLWQVFAQRRPILHKVLDWEDELFALITAFLDRQSLASSSSTFADSLYGLRRAPYIREGPSKSLTQQQQKVTLLLLVRAESCQQTAKFYSAILMHAAPRCLLFV